jgi:hypothetical protein
MTINGYAAGMKLTASRLNTTVGLEVRQSTGQTVANNSETILTWDVVDEDVGFGFSSGSGTITIPTDGIYVISCSIRWMANTNGYRRLSLYANSVLLADDAAPSIGNLTHPLTVGGKPVHLSAGTTVDARVVQTSGGPLSIAQTSRTPNLTIWRVA